MKLLLWFGLLLGLSAGHAFAADPNTPGSVPCIASGPASGSNLYPCKAASPLAPLATRPGIITPVNLDATVLSGSAATTVLTAGHALAGATITASVAYCINFNGTAGSTNNTPAGTQCGGLNTGFAAGQVYAVPATNNAVSVYGLTAGTASGSGAQ